jgi:hypothetical protein
MKHAILFCVLLSVSLRLDAQSIFFRASAGYALPLSNSQPVYITGYPYTGGNSSPDDTYMFEVKKASMFSGVRGSLGTGIMFSRIGFDISVTSVFSDVSYSFSGSLGNVYPVGSTTTITQSTRTPLMLMPALFMKLPANRVDIFFRAGPALPLNKKIDIESETIDGSNRYYDRSSVKTRFGVGLAFSAGIEYKITKSLRACAGIDILTMTLKATELNLLEAVNNGTDVLGTKLTFEKQTLYVEDLTNYTFSSDQPRQAQSYTIPFGSKGISVGVLYQL